MLNKHQHGFRKGHSCQTQLLTAVNDWALTINQGQSTHAIFLDFAKAFDTVAHQRLLLKLENLGIRGNVLNWIKGFISNRHQRVLLNGETSSWQPVISGVPQGSILGPLLFILYINDIGNNLKSPIKLFADDCVVYRRIVTRSHCIELQVNLHTLYRWTQDWQLGLNKSKCKSMDLTNKRKPVNFSYSFNNTNLEQVKTYKYLGVILDGKLSWAEHVNQVKTTAMRTLNLLRQTLHGCNKEVKAKSLYSPRSTTIGNMLSSVDPTPKSPCGLARICPKKSG